MTYGEPFVDYYTVLQVEPDCSARALETAYHLLAKMYHPDHSDAADVNKLTEVIEAYKGLRDPDARATYDLRHAAATGYVFTSVDEESGDDKAAISDADAHEKILMFLYRRRRNHAQDAGVGRFFVQELLGCSDDVFEFHLWYLKEKAFIKTTEDGTLAITISGVDQVISSSRTTMKEKLLIAQSSDLNGEGQS